MFGKSDKPICPLLKKPCVERGCAWYSEILGTNPQSGESLNKGGCAISWMPILTIENSQQQRQTSAAVESFRNETVASNNVATQLLAQAVLRAQMPEHSTTPTKLIGG